MDLFPGRANAKGRKIGDHKPHVMKRTETLDDGSSSLDLDLSKDGKLIISPLWECVLHDWCLFVDFFTNSLVKSADASTRLERTSKESKPRKSA